MADLLFSINATMPVVLLILAGYFLGRIKVMDAAFTASLNKFAYNVTLPFLLYSNMSTVKISDLWNINYVLLCMGATLFCFLIAALVSIPLLKNSKLLRGEFIQGSYRGSAILLAFAFVQGFYGKVTVTSLMILATVPLYNLLAVLVLSLADGQGSGGISREAWKGILLNLVKNPIIIGIAIGMLGSAFQPPLPLFINETIKTLGSLMTPLALLCLGASFEGRKARGYLIPTAIGCLLKLAVFPALLLPVAIRLGLQGEEMAAFLIMLASPTTVSCYVMARNTGHEGVLSSSMVLISTIASSITLTFWVYLLRTLGRI